jgi:hypothetical protein
MTGEVMKETCREIHLVPSDALAAHAGRLP